MHIEPPRIRLPVALQRAGKLESHGCNIETLPRRSSKSRARVRLDESILPRLAQSSCSFKPLLLASMLHLTALLSAASARELIFAVDSRRNAAAVVALNLCGSRFRTVVGKTVADWIATKARDVWSRTLLDNGT